MKAKKLVSLALPVMLLSGCITIETDDKKAEPKKEETQKIEKESKSTDSKKEDSLSVAKGEDKETSKSSTSNSTSSSNSSSKVTGSEVDKYKQDILDNANKIDETLRLIEDSAKSDIKSVSLKKSEIQLATGGSQAYVRNIKYLEPPTELKAEHDKIKESMDLYYDAFQLLSDAVGEESESKLKESITKSHQGAKLFEEATKSIASKTNPIQNKGYDV
ncbi:hypothetical protein ACH0BP_29845 [Bacillus nitratireducens]|uniref:hypothetical protein n=1 Tax=Bacillus nitratireducens TaxID=2026193 RepID=UPI0008FE499A|nr:hypothetical protein [Bacillus nitratireducens]OJD43428.1 hypothetical protein BAU23_19680 [Bacillus nitratireducens]